jgi:presenilin-like A22 family membrane protease
MPQKKDSKKRSVKKKPEDAWGKYGFIIPLFALFLLVQLLGLYLGYKTILEMQEFAVQPVTDPSFGVFIFVEILIVTAVVLFIIKYVKRLLKAFMIIPMAAFVAFFFINLLDGLVPTDFAAIIGGVASIAIITSLILRKDAVSQNLAILTGVTWAAANLGAMIGFYPVLVLLVLLSFYDFISVFKTKHMVTMAKEIVSQKIPGTMVIPTPGRLYHLGGGDLFMPMMMSVSLLRELGWGAALFTTLGACTGMVGIFAYMAGKKKVPLPAIPPIVACALLGLLLYLGLQLAGITF